MHPSRIRRLPMRHKLTAVFATLLVLGTPLTAAAQPGDKLIESAPGFYAQKQEMARELNGPAVDFRLVDVKVTPEHREQVRGVFHLKRERAEALAPVDPKPVIPPEPKPEPVAAEPAPVSYGGDVSSIITSAAIEFGLDPGYLLSVATCESTLNPQAYNPAGPYYGLFQFDATTWAAYGYGSYYDPVANARTAAELIAAGQGSRWPNCA